MIRVDGDPAGRWPSRTGRAAAPGLALVGKARDLEAARTLLPGVRRAHAADQYRPIQPTAAPLDLLWPVRGSGVQRPARGRHRNRAGQARPVRNDVSGPLAAIVMLAMVSGCSSSPPTFSLGNVVVDATFACP